MTTTNLVLSVLVLFLVGVLQRVLRRCRQLEREMNTRQRQTPEAQARGEFIIRTNLHRMEAAVREMRTVYPKLADKRAGTA